MSIRTRISAAAFCTGTLRQKRPPVSTHSVQIVHNGCAGVQRILKLGMPLNKANIWVQELSRLMEMLPATATPAHWRWAYSCMAHTSSRGKVGRLRRSELLSLMRCANASASLGMGKLDGALQIVQETEDGLELPQWLRACRSSSGNRRQVLNARQVIGMLLHQCTSSMELSDLLHRYGGNSQIGEDGWLEFVRTEQAASDNELVMSTASTAARLEANEELATAQQRFTMAASRGEGALQVEKALNGVEFALQILGSRNNAIGFSRKYIDATDDLNAPLAHCWMACSHNSYVIS
jgi:hypothetical protein